MERVQRNVGQQVETVRGLQILLEFKAGGSFIELPLEVCFFQGVRKEHSPFGGCRKRLKPRSHARKVCHKSTCETFFLSI